MGELGATKAVGAGKQPGRMGPTGWTDGPEYIWTLVRGEPTVEDGVATDKVFAIDGACRICQFPMPTGEYSATEGRESFTCKCCGTKWALDNGEVLEFLPKSNPIQWATALRVGNEATAQPCACLTTRISKSGLVYLRLPDNTII